MPLAFVLIWSTGFIVAKLAARHAPPLTFLAWRFSGAIVVMGAFALAMRAPWPRTLALWLHVVVAGLLLQATYLGGVWFAIARGVPAGVSALIVGTQPLLTAALAFTIGERVGWRQSAGLALGFVGVTLVLYDRLSWSGASAPALLVNVLALAGITAGTLYQKRHCGTVDVRTGTVIQYVVSLLVILPAALLLEDPKVDFAPDFWIALAWSVFGLSWFAITLLMLMIRRGRATEVASLMYLTPPATALLAWWVFGEQLGWRAWTGIAVAMTGVGMVAAARRAADSSRSGEVAAESAEMPVQ